jgi:hypothetical protein
MRPTAGNAALRPAQNKLRSASEVEIWQVVDLGLWPVELDDEERLDVERIAGLHEGFGRMDRRPVHHFHAARDDSGPDDLRHAVATVLRRGKADQDGTCGLRLA